MSCLQQDAYNLLKQSDIVKYKFKKQYIMEKTMPVACEYDGNPEIEQDAIKLIKTCDKLRIIPFLAYWTHF